MDYEKLYEEMRAMKDDYSSKLDESLQNNATANKRMFVIILALIAMIAVMVVTYFTSDYEIFPEMNQQQQMMDDGQMQQQQ